MEDAFQVTEDVDVNDDGVDVNTAGYEELQEIVHIGPARAGEIIELREEEPFTSVADLERVRGIGPATVADIKERSLAVVDSAESFLSAAVDIDPKTVNLRAQGNWINAYIELPDPHDVADIAFDTVDLRYEGEAVGADWGAVQNGVLIVEFDRASVEGWFEGTEDEVELRVVGDVGDAQFKGAATVRVIYPGRGGRRCTPVH